MQKVAIRLADNLSPSPVKVPCFTDTKNKTREPKNGDLKGFDYYTGCNVCFSQFALTGCSGCFITALCSFSFPFLFYRDLLCRTRPLHVDCTYLVAAPFLKCSQTISLLGKDGRTRTTFIYLSHSYFFTELACVYTKTIDLKGTLKHYMYGTYMYQYCSDPGTL